MEPQVGIVYSSLGEGEEFFKGSLQLSVRSVGIEADEFAHFFLSGGFGGSGMNLRDSIMAV